MSNKNIKLLSFDLDNTLYDNRPVIQRAESKNRDYLAQEFQRQKAPFDFEHFLAIRNELMSMKDQSEVNLNYSLENLTYLRQQVLLRFCQKLKNCEAISARALDIFLHYRSQVEVPTEIIQLLVHLNERYVVVGVSNGNCDPYRTSMGNYLQKHYAPHLGYRAKPHKQMLEAIKQDFSLEPENILHIGDQLNTDGKAAASASCQFFYFSPFEPDQSITNSCKQLLHHLDL